MNDDIFWIKAVDFCRDQTGFDMDPHSTEASQEDKRVRHPEPLVGDNIHVDTTVPAGYLTKSPLSMIIQDGLIPGWSIPSGPHSVSLNAYKSMRSGEQTFMSGKNGPAFDALPEESSYAVCMTQRLKQNLCVKLQQVRL